MPENQQDPRDSFEERLTTALRDTGDGFTADRAALVAGGQSRGRRARLRRRAGVLGGVAGIALVGVGGALLLPGGDGSVEEARTPAAAPAPSATPRPVPSYSGDDLLKELKGLLPDGRFSGEGARGTGPGLPPNAHLVYDDGDGPAAIGIGFDRVEPGSPEVRELTRCPDKTLVAYDACSTSRLPDGSLLMLYQGYEYPDRRVDTKWWSAQLVTARGQHITLSEWNAAAEKDAPVSREDPPLTPAQLTEVVTAGVWRDVVDAIPENPKGLATASVDEAPPAVSGERIGALLTRLLPEDVEVVTEGGQEEEYAYAVVDDGEGRSLVQINVQPGMTDGLYGSAETLDDGTLVSTEQMPGEKGGAGVVMWTVDTLRPAPASLRVVVSAFNSGAQDRPATREAPALTLAELREIALSPEWDTLAAG